MDYKGSWGVSITSPAHRIPAVYLQFYVQFFIPAVKWDPNLPNLSHKVGRISTGTV